MKKILIIGGAGFIGHNLALKLSEKNYQVEIIDGLNVNNLHSLNETTSKDNIFLYKAITENRLKLIKEKNIKFSLLDARNYIELSQNISKSSPDVIVHLAAVSHANKSNKNPHNTFDHSLRTLENALDSSRSKKTHFIYFSSSMIYGNFDGRNVSEEDKPNPIGIYGTLKLCGELIVKSYNQIFDLPYTIIRPSALYGERCISRRVGQIFIENAITKKPIIINGSGKEKLDFTYINDLINGVILSIENKKALNQTFNITYGNSREIHTLIEILKKYFNKLEVDNVEKEEFMPERGTLDITKAKKLLGYEPKHKLEEGYERYIEWYLEFWSKINKNV